MTLKEYAKQAKDRLRNGFWQEEKNKREVVVTQSVSTDKTNHDRLSQMINNYDQYQQEEAFYDQVVAIVESDEVVTNPLMLLADKQLLEQLSPSDKQRYMLKLSNHYQQAVKRYNDCH